MTLKAKIFSKKRSSKHETRPHKYSGRLDVWKLESFLNITGIFDCGINADTFYVKFLQRVVEASFGINCIVDKMNNTVPWTKLKKWQTNESINQKAGRPTTRNENETNNHEDEHNYTNKPTNDEREILN